MADKQLMILYLRQMLLDTDENHTLNASQIGEKMREQHNLSCSRSAIYDEIKRLVQYGMKIKKNGGPGNGYYVEERDFDLPELKLLVDAVQSSKFITREKSDKLIRKLERQTNTANAAELQRHVFILNRIKTDNDAIYKNVDSIHSAMRDNRRIRFKYCEWTVKKELVRRRDGADYVVSPWSLTWDDENYYLVGYDAPAGKIKHYRVDKMQEVRIAEESRQGKESFTNFDLAAYSRKTFGMYGGPDRKLTLEVENHLAGIILDRFGTDVMMHPHDENHFHVAVTVAVSRQFFGWLAGIGKGIRISWPAAVREEYRSYLQDIIES